MTYTDNANLKRCIYFARVKKNSGLLIVPFSKLTVTTTTIPYYYYSSSTIAHNVKDQTATR
eukprot:scaffold28072_cov122-Amphora_coffeaeformis.AAC.1